MAEILVNNVAGPIFDIATAVAAANIGDTITIENTGVNYSGVNNRNISLAAFVGASWVAPGLVIQGEESSGTYPVLDNDQTGAIPTFSCGTGDYVTIRQLTFISDNDASPIGIRVDTVSKHILVELCEFPDLGADGWYGRAPIQIAPTGFGTNIDAEIRCCLFNPNNAITSQRGIVVLNGAARVWVRHCIFWDLYYGIEHQTALTAAEDWDIENCTFYQVVAAGVRVAGIAATGKMHIKDNIFYGQSTAAPEGAVVFVNAPAGDVVSDYNDYFNNTNDRTNLAAGVNDIAVNPVFTGGPTTQWVGAISGSTSLLPTAVGVLTGAEDGACQGGWLPITEDMPCIEPEPEPPPEPPPDAPEPPSYDDCFGESFSFDCRVSGADGQAHVVSTTQLCPICHCLHTWAQGYVAARFGLNKTGVLRIETDASTIGGTPNSYCTIISGGYQLGSPVVSPGAVFVGFDVAGTPRMGGGAMLNCTWLDRGGFHGVTGAAGTLRTCNFTGLRATAVYSDGYDDHRPDGIKVCGCTFNDKCSSIFGAVLGGGVIAATCTINGTLGGSLGVLAMAAGWGSSVKMTEILLNNITWTAEVLNVSHGARIICNTALGTIECGPGQLIISVVDATLSLTNVNFNGGYILVQDHGLLQIAGGWHINTANSPTGYGAIQVSDSSGVDIRARYFRNCSALDAGGVIFLTGNSAAIIDAVDIVECTAVESGGGIALTDQSTVTLTRTSVRDCTAKRGGGIYSESSSVNCNELAISLCESTMPYSGDGNLARAGGGGMCLYNSSGYLWRLMISDCMALCAGAGLFIEGALTTISIQRLTVVRCEALKYGSAIFFFDVQNFNDLWDSIVALNDNPEGIRAWTNCSNVVLRYMNFWDNDGADYTGLTVTHSINTDPLFCYEALAGYGVVGCVYIRGSESVFNLFSRMHRTSFGLYSISREAEAASSGENEMIMGAGQVLCGLWNDMWRREPPGEYEQEQLVYYCTYEKFYDEYPPDWEYELSRKTDAQHVTIVCYDPGGRNIQLTVMVERTRPIKTSMSITFEEYQTKDIDIVFNDPDGWLDAFNPSSLIYSDEWKDKRVEIGSWMVGTQSVLVHTTMYLRGVLHDGHRTTWRCYDKYQKMLKRHMRANIVLEEDIENAGDAKLNQVDVADSTVCPISSWSLVFRNANDFTVYSELMGEDGEGQRTDPAGFTSTSGAIYIDASYWDVSDGDPKEGDTFRFISSLVIERTPAIEALEIALTNHYDLTAEDLDIAAWTQAKIGASVWIIDVVQKDPITALEFVRKVMRHVVGSLLIGSNGKLKPWRFIPALQGPGAVHIICSTLDLKKCEVENIENVDVVIAHYDKNIDGELMLTKRLPAVIDIQGIPALPYFEEQNREIWEFDLEFFDDIDFVVIDWLLRYLYELRVTPHPRYRVQTMLDHLNLQVGDVVWLESYDPLYDVCCLVYKVAKDLAKRNILVELMEAENWLATCRTFAYGYAFCDVHFCDDCWMCW